MKNITQTDIYIKMKPNKRLEIGTGLFDFTFERLETYFRSKYPDYSKDQILQLVRQRISHGSEKNIS